MIPVEAVGIRRHSTAGATPGASCQHFLNLVILRNVFHDHHSLGILDVFLQFVERPALRHDFRVLDELAEPELLGFPIDHRQFGLHDSIAFLSTVIPNLPHLSYMRQGERSVPEEIT